MTGAEFDELFEAFEFELFRFEQLPSYSTGAEDEPLRRWRNHEPPPPSISDTSWQRDLRRWFVLFFAMVVLFPVATTSTCQSLAKAALTTASQAVDNAIGSSPPVSSRSVPTTVVPGDGHG